ncbi:ankyrin repeat domain-containing protein 17-like [Branchiostoma lanceolatum]|uniref:ankyrin repeat domain-containing protein 17-like n=1 Tax=Branchiostoma lanceolatum TaxID=7740 RepID=UPI003454EA4C
MALQQNPVNQPELVSSDTLEAASDGRKGKPSESREDEAKELAQLNESLTRAAHTAHGRHPYRYGIASVNFKGDTRGTGNATLRKLLLGQLQEETRMSIIFVQECPWADPVKQLELEETFRYTGLLNEAGIIWNSDLFELKRLDSYKLIEDKYPNLIQHRGRVCISEMSIKVQPTGHTASSNIAVEKKPNVSDFIAISWHGPHKSTDAEKRLIFRDLLAFFKTLTVIENKDGQKACVIGGDFNFRLDKAFDNIDDTYPGLTIPASYGSDTIDYFIFTSDLINILHAQQLSLDYDVGSVYTAQDRDRARAETCKTASNIVIDHSPVFAVLDLGSPNPFSSPSKIRARKIAEPSRVDVTPDRSSYRRTQQATPGSSLKENKESPASHSVVGDNMSQADGERKGESPLHWAARDGHFGIVSALLRGGVDVNTRDSMQRTPLHEAAVNNHIATIQDLLVAGADVNARDIAQSTPLHDASTKGHHETVQALLVALADVNAQDIELNTPLHMAATNGCTEIVKTLLKAGADVNARDKEQRTPLHLTSRNGYDETVRALIMMGQGRLDFNAVTSQQWTPLHLAAMNGQHKAASALLTAKADVNARDEEQKTPLHLAAWNGDSKTVSVLLIAGADVNAQDKWCNTPIREAEKRGHQTCVEALQRHEADNGSKDKSPTKKRGYDPILIHFYEERGMTVASGKEPMVQEAARQTGKTIDQVKNFISGYRRSKGERKRKIPADNAGNTLAKASSLAAEKTNTLESASPGTSAASVPWQGLNINSATKETDHEKTNTQSIPQHEAARTGDHGLVSGSITTSRTADAPGTLWNKQETPRQKKGVDPVLVHFYEERGMTSASIKDPLVDEAAKQSGKTVAQVLNFISNYRRSKGETKQKPPADASGDDAVRKSSAAGAASAAEQVPKRGSAMDEKEQEMKEKELCEAAKNGDTAKVKQLLDEGVCSHATSGFLKRTPLHHSAENGHHKTVIALLIARAAVNTIDVAGRTALHMAAGNGHHNIVLSLVGAGATVNARGDQQLTPVHLAAMNGHHETVTALHTAGADVNARDEEERIPLHLAANNGYHETVSALLTAGSNVNAKNNEQRTSMHLAAMNGHHETVTLLVAAPGAGVNAKDNEQITPLHLAARNGDCETASALLTAGADVNAKDKKKGFPLHEATVHGHPKCVEVLLQHGADVAAKNEKGLMAKDIAKDGDTSSIEAGRNKEETIRDRKEIMKLLQEENARLSRERRESQAVLILYYEEKGMTTKDCPLIKEAAEKSGKSVEQVKRFINHRSKKKGDTDSGKRPLEPSGSSGDTVATESKDGVKKRRTEGAGVEDADDQGKPLQSKQADISVLLVNDEYRGNSTMNRRVAQLLLKHGAKVYSTALKATEEDKRCAANDGVNLLLPEIKSDMRPSLDWLTYYNSVHYPNIPRNLQYVVGYADVTSKAAKNIKEERCQEAKLVLFNNEMPDDNTTKKAADKVTTIIKDAKSADAVFSVGNRIYTHFETKYRSLEDIEPRHHYLFLPRASPVFEATGAQPGGGERLVLIFARMSEVMAQKGLDLAARAMGYAAEKIGIINWVVRWIQEDEDDWGKNKKTLEKKMQSPTIKPTIRPYGTQEEIARDIQHAHLVMVTSRSEPFGLIGLEAIAAGIPVLIPDQSGLEDMIKDLIKDNKCHADLRHRILIPSAGVKESDIEATARQWAHKISDSLEFSSYEFEKAEEFKKKLLESKYWDESHNNLLRVFGLMK